MASSPPAAEIWVPVGNIPGLTGEEPADLDNDDFSLKRLAQNAKQTLWNKLPLRAIAEAHKREAESLLIRGGLDDSANASNNAAVCLEYYKYLQLSPDKDSDEYRRVFQRVYELEQVVDGSPAFGISSSPDSELYLSVNNTTGSAADRSVSEAQSESMKWTFFVLGIATATIVPYLFRRVSRRR
ncbi:hypothetical protein MVEN_01572600 [Mycena venus]|uniref:Uncharacterized protein n=1 Tax=Mycena venus TaxID=2733690 RepID=A0A8H6XRR3_9AGAR|nr:hypothetical protein MVEN_01572600 [Mycena venus]